MTNEMIEKDKLDTMTKQIEGVYRDFMALVPFGRAGNDKQFAKVYFYFTCFVKEFSNWKRNVKIVETS